MTDRREFLASILSSLALLASARGDTRQIPRRPYDRDTDGDLLQKLAESVTSKEEFFALTRWVWPAKGSGGPAGLRPWGRWGEGLPGVPEAGRRCYTISEVGLMLRGAYNDYLPPISAMWFNLNAGALNKATAELFIDGHTSFEIKLDSYDITHGEVGWPHMPLEAGVRFEPA